jgi:hypothetical protein
MTRKLTLIGIPTAALAAALLSWFLIRTPASIPTEPEQATTGSPQRRLGPFSISGKAYTVVLTETERLPGSTQETGNTVVSMQIVDAKGAVQYERKFPSESEIDGFSDAWSVHARTITGTKGAGLLIRYELDSEPSAPSPENAAWWQLFGVVDEMLKPFSGPIAVQGALLTDHETPSDRLEFRVWAHHFRLVFPVQINWAQGQLAPAQECQNSTNDTEGCTYSVLAEDELFREDLTFVRLCPSAVQDCVKPQRVVVHKHSKVEFLLAKAHVKWSAGMSFPPAPDGKDAMADEGEITVDDDGIGLKVRVDGNEGWLHDEEDFTALGLPFEQ